LKRREREGEQGRESKGGRKRELAFGMPLMRRTDFGLGESGG
jgi:hypothetical protein